MNPGPALVEERRRLVRARANGGYYTLRPAYTARQVLWLLVAAGLTFTVVFAVIAWQIWGRRAPPLTLRTLSQQQPPLPPW